MTRNYPMIDGIPGESTDHPHHRSLYVAFGPILGLLDSARSNRPSYQQARQYLGALDTFAIGVRKDANLQVARVVVSLK